MADWVSKGSYQDLSSVLPGDPISALVPTSQEGGNMRASNEQAMTAPGSVPVDIMEPAGEYFHNDPTIEASNATAIEPADDGKPQASGKTGSTLGISQPRWAAITVPDVKRRPMLSANLPTDSGT